MMKNKDNNQNIPSKQAKIRLSWMKHYGKFRNARLTCRHFAISPSTFYHWKNKYIAESIVSLEDTASRKPKNMRKPGWNHQTILLIHRFMNEQPSSRKKDIRLFLAKQGVQVSASTLRRIMQKLAAHRKRFAW